MYLLSPVITTGRERSSAIFHDKFSLPNFHYNFGPYDRTPKSCTFRPKQYTWQHCFRPFCDWILGLWLVQRNFLQIFAWIGGESLLCNLWLFFPDRLLYCAVKSGVCASPKTFFLSFFLSVYKLMKYISVCENLISRWAIWARRLWDIKFLLIAIIVYRVLPSYLRRYKEHIHFRAIIGFKRFLSSKWTYERRPLRKFII